MLVGFQPDTGNEFAGRRFLGASDRENARSAPPRGNQGSCPAFDCQTDLRVGKIIMRAKDAWEPATDCAVRSQQTDDERTYTSFTKLRNSWIRARRSRIAKKRVSTLRMAALAIAKE